RGAQVDLILRAADGEPHGLIGGAAVQGVFPRDGYPLRPPRLLQRERVPAPSPARAVPPPRNAADPVTSRTAVMHQARTLLEAETVTSPAACHALSSARAASCTPIQPGRTRWRPFELAARPG